MKADGKDLVKTVLNPEKQEAPEALKLDENTQYGRSRAFSIAINLTTVILLGAIIVLSIIGYRRGIFTDQESLTRFVNQIGPAAPLIFTILQMVQVVIPILPGAIGCAVGVIVFGPIWGLVYNYIGICIGSIAAFMLARHFGKPFVTRMIGKKAYQKYIGWTGNDKRYERILALLIFLPVAPDDILCYISGITTMRLKKFSAIILLCKPFSIALYSLGLTYLLSEFWGFFSRLGA